MTTTTQPTNTKAPLDLAPLALDGSWIEDTRNAVAAGFDCGVCLDFGYLGGLGPCPHCDPDGYAEHVHYATQAGPQFGLDGADPWDSGDIVGVRR